jgi:DNA-binding NtrC family response regulator
LDAADSKEAILKVKRHKGPLPLLITDIVLPGVNGRVLAEKLTAMRPEMRVLFTSGYIEHSSDVTGLSQIQCAFLEKPFSRGELIFTVRGLLDAPAPLAA